MTLLACSVSHCGWLYTAVVDRVVVVVAITMTWMMIRSSLFPSSLSPDDTNLHLASWTGRDKDHHPSSSSIHLLTTTTHLRLQPPHIAHSDGCRLTRTRDVRLEPSSTTGRSPSGPSGSVSSPYSRQRDPDESTIHRFTSRRTDLRYHPVRHDSRRFFISLSPV